MLCPRCKSALIKVLESRSADNGTSIRRRRECEACKHRFTTFERIESTGFLVVKKDNTREPYDRQKLERGIWVACSKRPVSNEQIEQLVNNLEQKWLSYGKKEVASDIIGKDLVEALKELDDIAYIRFASVYRDFKDVETFKEELVDFLKKK